MKITIVGREKIFLRNSAVNKTKKIANIQLNTISNGLKANLLFSRTLVDFSELRTESPELKVELIFILFN